MKIKSIQSIIFFCSAIVLLTACTAADLVPTVITGATSAVTQTSAACGGTVTSDGGSTVTARGICWSSSPDPTIKNNTTNDGTGTGNFTSSLGNMYPGTTFYLRAYATNANGTGYGNTYMVTTPSDPASPTSILNTDLTYGTATDVDGNTYHTIKIGTQIWMAENLMVTHYNNGDALSKEINDSKWVGLKTGAHCSYNNTTDSNTIAKFGRFYNFYAVTDTRKLAPAGWHIATDAEWNTLITYLEINTGISGSVAAALAAKTDWLESSIVNAPGYLDPDTYSSLNNSSGFSCLPVGIRGDYGVYNYVTRYSAWWTTNENDKTTAGFRSLSNYGATTGKNTYPKSYGLSVRCIKD
jgi:uncharacterized protein (TIGR02145 family)